MFDNINACIYNLFNLTGYPIISIMLKFGVDVLVSVF